KQMSFCVLDCNRAEHYPLPAGHITSQLLTELVQKAHNNVLFRFVRTPKSRLYGEARRGTLACAGFLLYQSVNPSSLATII
ncbi:hypothetical protein BS580_10425, partial [Acinetobacter baumannii]